MHHSPFYPHMRFWRPTFPNLQRFFTARMTKAELDESVARLQQKFTKKAAGAHLHVVHTADGHTVLQRDGGHGIHDAHGEFGDHLSEAPPRGDAPPELVLAAAPAAEKPNLWKKTVSKVHVVQSVKACLPDALLLEQAEVRATSKCMPF